MAAQFGDHLVHRAAGRELDDREVDGDDAEQRRDHQQQAADQVGGHAFRTPLPLRGMSASVARASGEGEGRTHGQSCVAPLTLAASRLDLSRAAGEVYRAVICRRAASVAAALAGSTHQVSKLKPSRIGLSGWPKRSQ